MRYYFLKDFSDPPILYSKSAGGKGLAFLYVVLHKNTLFYAARYVYNVITLCKAFPYYCGKRVLK